MTGNVSRSMYGGPSKVSILLLSENKIILLYIQICPQKSHY